MTAARATKIDLSATPYYHCMTRCVRRTYLCGEDSQTGKDYHHRKTWIVERMKQLSEVFAINICAYAVMSNHYHLVLHVDENQATAWSEQDVFKRWEKIFPNDANQLEVQNFSKPEIKQKISLWRERLSSISWFMRCLNETIARLSNKEDNLTGRFWEGRFKSQALLDDGALLAAMAYVDLNPIRAKVAKTPEESEFTSIYERIRVVAKQLKKRTIRTTFRSGTQLQDSSFAKECDKSKQPIQLMPFSNGKQLDGLPAKIDFKLSDYLQLIDESGRILRDDKHGSIPHHLNPILTRLNLSSSGWLNMIKNLEKHFCHAIGHNLVLAEFGNPERQRNIKGTKAAQIYYLNVA